MNELTNEFISNELQLNSLLETYGTIIPDPTKGGIETSKIIHERMRTARLSVESKRKELKAPHLLAGREIDSKAKELIAKIRSIEDPHKAAIDEYRGNKKYSKLASDSVKFTESEIRIIMDAIRCAIHHSDDFTAAKTDSIIDKLTMSLNKMELV